MKTATIFIATMLGATALSAQNPLSMELKQQYAATKDTLMKSAERMPDADYSFKPTPATPGRSRKSSGMSPTFNSPFVAPPGANRNAATRR